MSTKTDHSNNFDREWFMEHALPIRLVGAGVCQLLAFILLIDSSGFIYGA